MDSKQVREHFESEAFAYDEGIVRLVPHYHEQHGIIAGLLPFATDAPIRALDLGCGTGVLSHLLLSSFPRAHVVAMDLTAGMLDRCATTLAAFAGRFTLCLGDFGHDEIGDGYDLVVSGLAIHHLEDAGKRELYRRILHAMVPGGMFLNRELVVGSTPAWTKRYEALWKARVGASGAGETSWFDKYRQEDLPASVETQTEWLNEIGFADVDLSARSESRFDDPAVIARAVRRSNSMTAFEPRLWQLRGTRPKTHAHRIQVFGPFTFT